MMKNKVTVILMNSLIQKETNK